MADRDPVLARIADGVGSFDAADWDACAGPKDPFVGHAFLKLLEDSGSVGGRSGWRPLPVAIDGADGRPAAVLPAYLKTHSQGEYVFDHGWAEAWGQAGGDYYPKLQIAVPFTPVPGRRLLARDGASAPLLIAAAETIVRENGLSSAHATFVHPDELPLWRAAGWLLRLGTQFHWFNGGYRSFTDFLDALSSRKRKAIRKEREAAMAGLEIRHLTGADLTEAHWDAFWAFYQDTGSRKWGRPYLTRRAFSLLGERMAERVLLILALRGGKPIAGALNLVGGDALYGRYWGATEEVPHLHFELCYYQAIEWAIAHGLGRVEAGAQGEHKLARGYRPVPTWSAHFIPHAGFRQAVADYLVQERAGVEAEMALLEAELPYKRDVASSRP